MVQEITHNDDSLDFDSSPNLGNFQMPVSTLEDLETVRNTLQLLDQIRQTA